MSSNILFPSTFIKVTKEAYYILMYGLESALERKAEPSRCSYDCDWVFDFNYSERNKYQRIRFSRVGRGYDDDLFRISFEIINPIENNYTYLYSLTEAMDYIPAKAAEVFLYNLNLFTEDIFEKRKT